MSDIKAGDLVMVVHQHCATFNAVGQIGEVSEVRESWTRTWGCSDCGSTTPAGLVARIPALSRRPHDAAYGWFPLPYLKKIDPLSEPIEQNEEATA